LTEEKTFLVSPDLLSFPGAVFGLRNTWKKRRR